ncbi:MAG: CDP-alcohol phosphatidyltransferase family protein [Pseudomonadota bacterium]
MKARDIPNLITGFRFLLVPPVVMLLLNERFGAALILFGVAGLSDGLDGYLAKRNNWTSRLGALMDPLADKLLLVSCFVTLGWMGWIPLWLVALVVLRDLVIVGGAIMFHMRVERLEAEPSMVSKLNTFAQILLVLAVIFSQGIHELPPLWLDIILYSVLATTLWSGFDYVWTWGRRALNKRGQD